MRRNLFAKAKYLLNKKRVKIVAETDYSIRFEVGEEGVANGAHEVELKYQNHKLIALCNCKAGAFNQICAHSLAAQAFIIT